MSLVLGNYTAEKLAEEGKPNEYVLQTSHRGWFILEQLMDSDLGVQLSSLLNRRDWPVDPLTLGI